MVFRNYKSSTNGPLGSAKHNRDVLSYKSPANGPLGSAKPNRGVLGYKSTTNGPSGSAEHNKGVLGLQILRQWALGFRRTHSGCFEVKNPPPMGPRVPPNTLGVFWG
ncbi:Hypothetical protein FKW44_019719 [Caligus rogercresseyi]|uniref:Uncharacterized protein n=1 Tax=Caligus rogercresseyi TaxID=217165 RepID=A0A7T8JYB8_CALRO|nr:Hypothetical protein FKW44_019719 [Caligus rogercresseyi]